MANFLDDLTSYNAKASAAIAAAVTANQQDKANLMSSLKSTANDTTLTDAVRLEALTALINVGRLLDIPLPPYFPVTTTYATVQSYAGIHNDLSGLQGGQPGEYYHLTASEKANILNKAGLGDINWANLGGVYTDNVAFAPVLSGKQNQLNGTGFVKVSGTTVSYDNSTYLTSTSLNALSTTGELSGTYGATTLSNAAVIGKVLTGFNGSVTGTITSSDTILQAIQKLNANLNYAIANPTGVASVAFTNNATSVFTTTASPSTGAAVLSLSLDNQAQNLFLASPNASSGQPSFRSIVVNDLPTSGVTAGTYGSTTDIPQIVVDDRGRITSVINVASTAGGQVNTVGISTPALLPSSVIGTATDPIISIGLTNNIVANTVFAGPTYGLPNDTPTFRALETYDIPALPISQITSLQDTLDTFLTGSLANSTIYMGNASDAAINAQVTGDLTAVYVDNNGTNEAQFTIANAAVTYAKFQDIPGQILLGRYDATTGPMQQITLDPLAFTLNSGTGVLGLVTPNPPTLTTKGDILTSTGSSNQVRLPIGANATIFMADTAASTGNKWVAISGDATINTSGVLSIGVNQVSLNKLAQIPIDTILGNNTANPDDVVALTGTEVTAILDQFTSTLKGVVPQSGGGTTNFLRADGSWAAPPSGGSGTVNSGTQYNLAYYATTGTAVSQLGSLGTSTQVLHGNASGAPTWGAVALGSDVSGQLPLANGGTNANLTAVAGAVAWSSSSAIGFTAAATAGGQLLQSQATTTNVPVWTSASYPIGSLTQWGILYASTSTQVSQITAPTDGTFLKYTTAGGYSWATAGGGIAIGDTITSSTAGSVLFVGTGGVLDQDNAEFFWDDLNKYLGIGTATPECGLHVITSGSSNIKGIMNMHFDSTAANQAKFIGARARGNKNTPAALQTDDAITSLSGRGYKASTWSNTVGGFYIYASENWTNTATGTYMTMRGVVAGGTTVSEWARMTSTSSLVQLALGQASTKSGSILLYSSGGASTTTIQASPSASTSETYVLPATDGTSGQVIQTDGSGVLSWANNGTSWSAQYIKSTTATAYPANTAQGVFLSVLIPANTFGSGSVFKILTRISKSGAGTSSTLRIGFNTTNANLTGIVWISIATTFGSGAVPGLNVRHISIESTSTSFFPSGSAAWSGTTSSDIVFNPAGGNPSTVTTIDWTVNQYFIVAASTAATDTFTNNFISISPT